MKTLKTLTMMLMALGLSLSAAAQKECCKAKACQPTHQFRYTKQATDFCFYANPDAKSVVLRLYDEGLGGKPVKTVKLQQDRQQPGYWKATVKGDLKGKFYTIDQSGNKKEWVETPGVFATAVGVNGKRGYIYEPSETNPEGWCKDKRPELKSPCDLVIYEMHHRDYSIARNTTLSPTLQKDAGKTEYPSKFLALTEPWAIEHLKNLGVNAIHILPSYDYGSVDETRLSTPQFNWGYDPVNYNVPEGSYSTDPYNPLARIREFKQMVQALHKAGIRVILDVVYNHTYDIEHSNFQRTYPDYYYRKNADGSYSNGSGCGNETASEKPMMRKFMIESVRHWINECHIDGLRFDVMGVHDIETMNAIRHAVDEIDPSIFIYGEGWSAGSCAYPQEKLGLKAHIRQMPRIAAFSDDLRDALRGPFSDDTKGAFLAGLPGSEESIKAGIACMISHPQVDFTKVNYSKESWVNEPSQMISYVSCHDDMCLVDRLKASIPSLKTVDGKLSDSQLAELVRLDKLAQTAVMLSQGVPFMLNGEELLRDKKGVHNSFESPDSINQINWGNLARYPQVFDYYKSLLQLRKNHPAFRLGRADLVRRHLEFLPSQDALVAFRLKDYAGGDIWNNIIVVLNGSKEEREVTIPEGTYTIVACDGVINEQGLGEITGQKVSVDPQSALIIKN